jgi:peptide chain release factor subunit 3
MQEEKEVPSAFNGDNVRIRLKNIEEEELQPGFVLCSVKNPVHSVTSFEAQVALMDYPSIITAGFNAVLHAHTACVEVTISELLHKIDKKTNKKSRKPPNFMKQGDACIVRFEVLTPICLELYSDYPQLGRFNLRNEGDYF